MNVTLILLILEFLCAYFWGHQTEHAVPTFPSDQAQYPIKTRINWKNPIQMSPENHRGQSNVQTELDGNSIPWVDQDVF